MCDILSCFATLTLRLAASFGFGHARTMRMLWARELDCIKYLQERHIAVTYVVCSTFHATWSLLMLLSFYLVCMKTKTRKPELDSAIKCAQTIEQSTVRLPSI
eukprot:4267088-Amphidinium_carterae.1